MNCKRCGTALEDGARFCPKCGALQPMICPACGAESRPGSKECSACGKKLPLADREDKLVYPKRQKHTGAMVATVIGVVVAVALLIAAALYLRDTMSFEDKSQQEQPSTAEPQPEAQPPENEPAEIKPVENEPAENKPGENEPSENEPTEKDPPENEPAEKDPPEKDPTEDEPAENEPSEQEPPAEEPPADDQWIFPDSSERKLTQQDLEGLSAWELKVARNEIYARHGRRFNSAELQAHFDSCSWYEGTIDPDRFDESVITDLERENINLLRAAEQ